MSQEVSVSRSRPVPPATSDADAYTSGGEAPADIVALRAAKEAWKKGLVAPSEAKRSASRVGRKAIYAWVDPAEHRKLKKLSLDTERSIDALVTEAVHLLFEKHNAA